MRGRERRARVARPPTPLALPLQETNTAGAAAAATISPLLSRLPLAPPSSPAPSATRCRPCKLGFGVLLPLR
ncbi:hypothetical protein U1Q18_022865 [Sarracenia purpurea var. burkii]